jgi:mono/diheme cytochrome c family protein
MRSLILIGLSFVVFSCNNGSSPQQETAVNAKDIYTTRCAGCHGLDGQLQMSGAKALPASTLKKEEVVTQIQMGKGNMPPFDSRLSPQEIKAVADYVIQMRPH